jgi:hypothetical protein
MPCLYFERTRVKATLPMMGIILGYSFYSCLMKQKGKIQISNYVWRFILFINVAFMQWNIQTHTHTHTTLRCCLVKPGQGYFKYKCVQKYIMTLKSIKLQAKLLKLKEQCTSKRFRHWYHECKWMPAFLLFWSICSLWGIRIGMPSPAPTM